MADAAKRQISFKLDAEVAERLDQYATARGVSCHEAARSLMLSGLSSQPRDSAPTTASGAKPDVLSAVMGEVLSRLQSIEDAVTVPASPANVASLVGSLLSDQAALLRAVRLLARESSHLRTRHLPALRKDMQTAVVALLCKGTAQADPDEAAKWVGSRLNAPIPELGAGDA